MLKNGTFQNDIKIRTHTTWAVQSINASRALFKKKKKSYTVTAEITLRLFELMVATRYANINSIKALEGV